MRGGNPSFFFLSDKKAGSAEGVQPPLPLGEHLT